MKRRDFLKTTLGMMAAAGMAPDILRSSGLDRFSLSDVSFDSVVYERNNAQTLAIFLVGGMSDFVGNATHLEQIRKENLSLKPYPQDGFTVTKDGFWQEGGGALLQRMLDDPTMQTTYFKTAISTDLRRSHGLNQRRYMHGHPTIVSGIPITLMHVLNSNGVVNEDTLMPYVRLLGGKEFFDDQGFSTRLPGYLRPVTIEVPYWKGTDAVITNPYRRRSSWPNDVEDAIENLTNSVNDPSDEVALALQRRGKISEFVENVKDTPLPDGIEYPRTFSGKIIEAAMRILIANPDTKIVTTEPENRWDDHSNALSGHKVHATDLFEAIEAAMQHMKAEGRDNINIVVYGDFGRNMNINSANGWDHGNNQVVYWFGGERYLNQLKVVGETELHVWMKKARLYSRPTKDSYWFEPYSIAATIYRLYGITNPEVLTGGYGVIDPSIKIGQSFLKA